MGLGFLFFIQLGVFLEIEEGKRDALQTCALPLHKLFCYLKSAKAFAAAAHVHPVKTALFAPMVFAFKATELA